MTNVSVITTDDSVTVVDNSPNITVETTNHIVVVDSGGSTSNSVTGANYALSIGTVATGATASASLTGNAPYQILNLVLPKGDTGAAGANGSQGLQGIPGSTGAKGDTGAAGNTVRYGTTNPVSSTGVDGDFYINITTNTMFGPKVSGTWPVGVSLIGPQGPTGAAATIVVNSTSTGLAGSSASVSNSGTSGAARLDFTIPRGDTGANGNTILSGSGAPSLSLGANGDFYIRTDNNTLYGPKSSGSWPGTGVNLVGPQGSIGNTGLTGNGISSITAPGSPGQAGATDTYTINYTNGTSTSFSVTNGTNGNTIRYGSTTPPSNSLGANGDFYICTTAPMTVFGPKAGGVWPSGTSLVGPTGPQGNTVLSGTGQPTNQGVNGDYFLDTAGYLLYGPKAANTWPASGVSLRGNRVYMTTNSIVASTTAPSVFLATKQGSTNNYVITWTVTHNINTNLLPSTLQVTHFLDSTKPAGTSIGGGIAASYSDNNTTIVTFPFTAGSAPGVTSTTVANNFGVGKWRVLLEFPL